MNVVLVDDNDSFGTIETAEEWLKQEDPSAYGIRKVMISKYGSPGSKIRPEGNLLLM